MQFKTNLTRQNEDMLISFLRLLVLRLMLVDSIRLCFHVSFYKQKFLCDGDSNSQFTESQNHVMV